MYFLTSLLYLFLFFIVPGQIFFIWLSPKISFIPEEIALLTLSILSYALIGIVVRVTRFADRELDGYRIKEVRELKRWLRPEGIRGFTVLMLILLGGGVSWLAMTGGVPVATWPLYAAIALGSLDVWRKSPPPFSNEAILPDLADPPSENGSHADESRKDFSFTWLCPSVSEEHESRRYRETFKLVPDWDGPDNHPTALVRSLDDYGALPRVSLSNAILTVAKWFREESIRRRLSPVEELANLVAFIRSLPENPGESYSSPPDAFAAHRLLLKGGSSSETRAVLAVTLLLSLGHEVALLYRHAPDGGSLSVGFHGELPATFCVEDEDGRLFAEVDVSASGSHRRSPLPAELIDGLTDDQVIPIHSL